MLLEKKRESPREGETQIYPEEELLTAAGWATMSLLGILCLRAVPMLVPVCASPVPSGVRESILASVKFLCSGSPVRDE